MNQKILFLLLFFGVLFPAAFALDFSVLDAEEPIVQEASIGDIFPSSVCENELVDITITTDTYPGVKLNCVGLTQTYACFHLWESDNFGDDPVAGGDYCGYYPINEVYIPPITHTFHNIDLGEEIIGDPGDEGEFYVEIIIDCKLGLPIETTHEDVYGYVNGECDCISGACCDLSSRPYDFKSSSFVCNSEYSFDYGCPNGEGTSYPGEDVFKRVKQQYCSGASSSCSGIITSWLSWSLFDACSLDEYCTDNDSSCNSCGYHTTYSCYSSDVYWYDNCGNLEDKKQECGSDYCDSWSSWYCSSSTQKQRSRTCYDKGCSSSSCFSNSSTDYETENCSPGTSCSGGICVADPIECYSNSNCGTDGYVGVQFCSTDDVYQPWRTFTCNNPGTTSSYCSSADSSQKIDECGEDYCDSWGSWYCASSSQLKRDRTCYDKGCSSSSCFSNSSTDYETQYCPENTTCSGGVCIPVEIECSFNSDCGTDAFVGLQFCFNEDVYVPWRTFTCNNPGTTLAYCSSSDSNMQIAECGEDSYSANYCFDNDVYKDFTDRGCSGVSCFENTTQEKVEECPLGCNAGACIQTLGCGATILENTMLTEDLLDCNGDGLVIGFDDISLDCAGHLITGVGIAIGIRSEKNRIEIENCNVSGFLIGVYSKGNDSNFFDNNLFNNNTGIYFNSALNNFLVNSNLTGNFNTGISLVSSSNNFLFNNMLLNNNNGLTLSDSSGNSVNSNILENSSIDAIHVIDSSSDNLFWNNSFLNNYRNSYENTPSSDNDWNFGTVGNFWDDFSSNPGYPFVYEISGPSAGIDFHPVGALESFECGDTITEDTVLHNDLIDCSEHGLIIGADDISLDCNGHTIKGVPGSSMGDYSGIYIESFDDITVKNCEFYGFDYGLSAITSMGSSFFNNSFNPNAGGLLLYQSEGNIVYENDFNKSYIGVGILDSSFNLIFNNDFTETEVTGVGIINRDFSSTGNSIWYNSFVENTGEYSSAFEFEGVSGNFWNDGETGNFWDDFESNPGYPFTYEISGPGDGIDFWPAGKFINTPRGDNIVVDFPEQGVNVLFEEVQSQGYTSVESSSFGPVVPEGFMLLGNYYDISTSAVTSGITTVCIDYNESLALNENNLKLYHFDNNVWVDKTNFLDVNSNKICAFVPHLSFFMVAEPEFNCGLWGDVSGDGRVDPLDVVYMINYVYRSLDSRVELPYCPFEAGDVSGDGLVNPLDVVYFVNYVYKFRYDFINPCEGLEHCTVTFPPH